MLSLPCAYPNTKNANRDREKIYYVVTRGEEIMLASTLLPEHNVDHKKDLDWVLCKLGSITI